jgi:hypothetical protein
MIEHLDFQTEDAGKWLQFTPKSTSPAPASFAGPTWPDSASALLGRETP